MPYRIAIDARKVDDFGIGTYIRNLVRYLGEIDRENQYFLLVRPTLAERLGELPANFRWVAERSRSYTLREQVSVSWRLLRLRVDLYHATHYVLPLFVPSPSIVTIHDIIHLLFPELLPSRLALHYARRMIRRSLNRGDRIITVSENTRVDLRAHFRVDERKIRVIYNGVEPVFHNRLPEAELERWLSVLGLERGYVLFVGNPKPHKNLDNTVKAFARALSIRPFDAQLVCVGAREGSDFKLMRRAEQLGVGDRLRLLGHVASEALPAIYQGASLFLYPTLYEGFGLPVVEAMASGVPVITSKTSALREIAQGYAHLVDPLDTDEIAKAIAHLLNTPEQRSSLAALGSRRSRDFDWQRTAQATHDLYLEVLEKRNGGSAAGSHQSHGSS